MAARWRTAAVAACLAVCAVPAVAAPAVPGCAGRDATGPDAWTTVRPAFGGKSGANVVDMAVVPLDPAVIYATDGATIAMTRDGGCTWRDLGADGGLPAVAEREVVAIDVSARSADGESTVWILSNVSIAGVARPEVLVAVDGAGVATAEPQAWSLGGLPIGAVGEAVTLAAGTDPDYAYVVVNAPGVGRQLLATQNRGQLWEQRTAALGSDVRGVVADSVYPNLVWTWGLDGLFHSTDGGAAFTAVEAVPGPVSDVGVAQSPKGTRVLVLQPNGVLWRSDDGGQTYRDTRVDLRSMSVAVVPVLDVGATAGRGVVTVFPATFGQYDVSPRGEVWVDDLAAALDGERIYLVARTQDVLRVREVDVDTAPRPGDVPRDASGRPLVSLAGPVTRVPLYPALNPSRGVVTLAPGETRDVEYRLEIPATPTPIDVHFVVDTTGSMQPVIDALRFALAKIVNDLTVAGIDASFGVGDFRDVPASGWGSDGDHVYKLLRPIGPVDDELEGALNALRAGGGGDGPEATHFALYEAVRHAAGAPTFLEEPEGDTAFHDGALRLAVVATDTKSHHAGETGTFGEGSYPGPDYDQLIAALLKGRVRVMGISAGGESKSSLAEIAFDSGAVAPEPGIDCNGDGRIDLPEGEPLVCDFVPGAGSNVPVPTPIDPILGPNPTKNMSSAIIAMLRGVQDPSTVSVRSSAPDVARVLTRPSVLDMKTPNAVPVKVRYTCAAANYGKTIPVRLPAFASGRQLAEASAEVRCGAKAPPEEILVPPAVPRVVAVAAAPPPPPPPAPGTHVNPNPNPNANPQTNLNLQTGVAAEEQQVPQLALVWDELNAGEAEELAMSRRDDPVPAVSVLCAGVLMAGAAYGLAYRRRTQVSRARST